MKRNVPSKLRVYRRSTGLLRTDARYVSVAGTVRTFDLAPAGGRGAWITDVDGRRYLDFTGGWGAANAGYGDSAIRRAVTDELRRGPYTGIASAVMRPAARLAARLSRLVPCQQPCKVWFGHSGSDAIDFAVRAAKLATGRREILGFLGGRHGSTALSAAIGRPDDQESLGAACISVPYPNTHRSAIATFGAMDEAGALHHLRQVLMDHANKIAVCVLEAMQAYTGFVTPSDSFLRSVETLCRQEGILLLLDEVKVGMGRTGEWFAYQRAGLCPDLVVLGKAVGGGLPLSAIVGRADVLDRTPGLAAMTVAGNSASCSAGLAAIRTIERKKLVAKSHTVGIELRAGLLELAKVHPLIDDVRGRGLALAMDLDPEQVSNDSAKDYAAQICMRAAELGLLIFRDGPANNILEITPPLCLSEAEAGLGLAMLDQAMSDVESGWKPTLVLPVRR
jgi:4-aminobutyrate aminotransferase